MIIYIAKNELKNLFFSPIAWFVILVFLTMCSYDFSNNLFSLANYTDLIRTLYPNDNIAGLIGYTTAKIYGLGNLFFLAAGKFYLFVPLLAMGLINRDKNIGTIQLLYSSPIKPHHIALGKYVGLMMFNLILLSIILFFSILGFFVIDNIDYSVILSGLFGILLIMSVCSAVGLYMSSLTTYQIISALATFFVLFLFSNLGGLWQNYAILRDITWALALNDRIANILTGLIRTKDVLLFLNLSALFIIFTIFQMQRIKRKVSWKVTFAKHLYVLLIAGSIQYLFSKPQLVKYWDLTASQTHTITEEVQEILLQLKDAPLEATMYCNLLDATSVKLGLPSNRNNFLESAWDRYLRFKPDINLKYEYYYDNNPVEDHAGLGSGRSFEEEFPDKDMHEVAREMARIHNVNLSLFKSPEAMRKYVDLDPFGHHLGIMLKYKDRSEFFFVNSNRFDPIDFGTALKRLIAPVLPHIAYVSGNLERDVYQLGSREYGDHAGSKISGRNLFSKGFRVDTLNLDKQDIPQDITAIVLADPREQLSETALGKLQHYIEEGRNMFILGEPGKQAIISPLLRELGLEMLPGMIVEPRREESFEYITGIPGEGYWRVTDGGEQENKSRIPDPRKTHYFNKAGVFNVLDSKYVAVPLFVTKPYKSWLDRGSFVYDSVPPVFNASEGDIYGSFSTSLLLTRPVEGREQRMVIMGDADFLSNSALLRSGGGIHVDIARWLHYDEFPIKRRKYEPNDFISITPQLAKMSKPILVILLPCFVLLCGFVILKRRNRK